MSRIEKLSSATGVAQETVREQVVQIACAVQAARPQANSEDVVLQAINIYERLVKKLKEESWETD